MIRRTWPDWWEWEVELSPHLLKRMADRRFTEVDLRTMLDRAVGYTKDPAPGRFRINTRHRRKQWVVIVEPDAELHLLVVVTAFPLD